MHSSLIAWIMRAIPFGTIIMYGALGETVTEKSIFQRAGNYNGCDRRISGRNRRGICSNKAVFRKNTFL